MNPHIIFNIKGISGISISGDEHRFDISKNDNIESVELLLENKSIIGIKVIFGQAILIEQTLVSSTQKLVDLFVACLISELEASITKLEVQIGNIYNPNFHESDGSIKISSTIGLSCSLTITSCFPITRYANIFEQIPTAIEKQDAFIVLGNIMKIDNIAIRYLMQYEFLMSLVSQHKRQKDVTDYVKNSYNPTLSFNSIGFHPTRREGHTYDEDDITYYRNFLAHADTVAMPEDINEKIGMMSIAMMQVIRFSLNQI